MAVVTGSTVEERLCESCFQEDKCRAILDDAASECSTTSGSNDITHFDTCSNQGEEGFVETCTFFDWDDTLFPTAWLEQQQVLIHADVVLREDQIRLFETLATRVERSLRLALQFGKVVIVTNAQQGWVETCCAKLMPSLSSILEQVEVVSARSAYGSRSHCPSEWKRLAFEHEMQLCQLSSALQYNAISIGDALYEQQAVMSLCEKMQNCFGKSVKFLGCPTIEQLIDEHDFLVSCFLAVAEHNGNLDVEVTL